MIDPGPTGWSTGAGVSDGAGDEVIAGAGAVGVGAGVGVALAVAAACGVDVAGEATCAGGQSVSGSSAKLALVPGANVSGAKLG